MNLINKFKLPLLLTLVFLVLVIWQPDIAERSTSASLSYLKEMILIIPPVFILMGLLEAWVPKEKFTNLIGGGSGFKGILLSFVM